ncbi:MAG: hypothetical protein JWO60_3147 [Frankiales bacterium]|nr:hypothetical protein [Frankiales bacterium]
MTRRTALAPAALLTSVLVRTTKPNRPLPEKVRVSDQVALLAVVRVLAVSTSRPLGSIR